MRDTVAEACSARSSRVRMVVGTLLAVGLARAVAGEPPDAHVRAGDARQAPARTPDIYFVPTSQSIADAMLTLARVTDADVVYDLGSGDGRLVILAAQKYGARGVGVEIDPRLVEISRVVAREGAVADRVRFVEGDLFTADIAEATVVTLYLSPNINRRLGPRLQRELRAGARVVSHQFPIPGWTPDRIVRADDGTDLYLWTVPGR